MMTGAWIAQKQKGGFVGYLESQGHVVNYQGSDYVDLIGLGTRRPQGCCELKPMYVAITNSCDFVFPKAYKAAWYKLTVGMCGMALRLPDKLHSKIGHRCYSVNRGHIPYHRQECLVTA